MLPTRLFKLSRVVVFVLALSLIGCSASPESNAAERFAGT